MFDEVSGVGDGTRTRDYQNHNLVFYQLNYAHHQRAITIVRTPFNSSRKF